MPVAPVLRGPSREARPTPRQLLLVRSKVCVVQLKRNPQIFVDEDKADIKDN